jgi:CDP-paratose 2-epimerase
VLDEIAAFIGRPVAHGREGWRSGDQLYFVADTRRLTEAVPWHAHIGWRQGLRDLAGWVGAELSTNGQAQKTRGRRVPA